MNKLIKDFEIKIDPKTSAVYVKITNSKISKTENLGESLNTDLDSAGQLVGLEVLDIESLKEIGESAGNLGLSKGDIQAILSELEAQI